MSANEEQPKPIATDKKPAWNLVIEYVQNTYPDEYPGKVLMLADMTERDQLGRHRYGVPLTASNGRNQMLDAYQESLDFAVYLAAALDERGAFQLKPNDPVPSDVEKIAGIFTQHMAYLPIIRELALPDGEFATPAPKSTPTPE